MPKHTPATSGSNGLRTFTFRQNGDHPIRVFQGEDGKPLWIAKDVCEALGLGATHMALKRVESDDRNQISVIDTMGRKQKMSAVTEPGLYCLILRSDKPEAKTFKRWVTHEVLPAIRCTGSYVMPGSEAKSPVADRRPRLSGALLGRMKDHLGHQGTTAAMIRIWPEWFANLPGERPMGPQQVVRPTLGLTEPLRLELRQVGD